MSLERKPVNPPPSDEPAPRTLRVSANPAQRLQELLRREAQIAREAQQADPSAEAEAPSAGDTFIVAETLVAETVIVVEPPAPPVVEATPPPEPAPSEPAAVVPDEPAPSEPTAGEPMAVQQEETPPAVSAPSGSPPADSSALWKREPVTLLVVVNSERHSPVEYPSMDEMPTVNTLEETYGAFLLSDEWQRRGPTLTRVIRLRRRRR